MPFPGLGVAKQISKATDNVRNVLEINPQLSAFTMPPQVQMGITALNAVGFKVPSQEEILKIAQGKLDGVLGGLRNKATSVLDKYTGKILAGTQSAEEILQKIDWLL
jgi:hypothetical protein